ncbi:hypothetical protein ACFLV2_02955 [Chloroflexota bacterium]
MEKEPKFNLNIIKKIITTSSISQVNSLLKDGWILLEIQKEDYGHPKRNYDTVIYHLGHTDPKANEHKNEYTRPEDLKFRD